MTVTVTVLAVPVWPLESVQVAEIAWLALAAVSVFQLSV